MSTSEENIITMAQVGQLPTNAEAICSLNDQPKILQPNNAPNDPSPRPEPHTFELSANCMIAAVWIINDKKSGSWDASLSSTGNLVLVHYLSTWRESLLATMNIGGILGTLTVTQVKLNLIK